MMCDQHPAPAPFLCRYTGGYAAGEVRRADVHLQLAVALDISPSMLFGLDGSKIKRLDVVLDCIDEICRLESLVNRAGTAKLLHVFPMSSVVLPPPGSCKYEYVLRQAFGAVLLRIQVADHVQQR